MIILGELLKLIKTKENIISVKKYDENKNTVVMEEKDIRLVYADYILRGISNILDKNKYEKEPEAIFKSTFF